MPAPLFRPAINLLPSYRPTEGVYGAGAPMRPLSANETPDDPLPGIVEAIASMGSTVHRYPDPGCGELTRAIARVHGIDPNRVLVGAGSVALLQALFQAVGRPRAEVVFAWRSFELYPVLAELAGLRSVQVPLAGATHDLKAMARSTTEHTRLVVVCNPNNPTGTMVTNEQLRAFLASIPSTCLIALDEAYVEYVRTPDPAGAVGLCDAYPNLVVLRTFSKAYGLAGLRVGYLLGSADVVAQLGKACLAYAVNTVAQRAAEAALGLRDELSQRVDATVAERTRVRDTLRARGWPVPDAQGNFLWLPLGSASGDFGGWCASRHIAVRTFPGEGVRVSVGSAEDNDAFLAAMADWDDGSGASPGNTARRQ